ncbi:MAG: c-type cytochrome domain-containing protein, partial [Planctomyces sp.]
MAASRIPMSRFIRLMVAGILFAALVTSLTAESSGLMASEAADPGTPSEFFHQRVEPVLKRHCYECHSHNSGVMESGLALDWKNGWVTGGKRGPAIVPGRPEESLLIRAISHLDEHLKMPEEKLAEDQIATLTEWVRSGAWDDRVAEPKPQDPLDWWSLKPLLAPALPEKNDQTETSFHPIDLFVSARLKDSGLSLSERATPRD